MTDVARYFDREEAYDGYTGALLFYCQFSSFDDKSADGSTSRRRTLSVSDAVEIPARRCIELQTQRWLIGNGNDDSFLGKRMRQSFGMKRVTDLATIMTPAQACNPAGTGTAAYAQLEYFKDTVNSLNDSGYDTFWNTYFAPDEPVLSGSFLKIGTRMLRVRQRYTPVEGLLTAQSDELDADWSQSITFTSNGTYSPITDALTTISTAVNAVQTDLSKFYKWQTASDADTQAGDKVVFVPAASITPLVGAVFTMASRSWRVLSVVAEADSWALHVRPA